MNLGQVYAYWDVVTLQNLRRLIVHVSEFNSVDDVSFKYFERYVTELYLILPFLLVFAPNYVRHAKGKLGRLAFFIIYAVKVHEFNLEESYCNVELWKPLLILSYYIRLRILLLFRRGNKGT